MMGRLLCGALLLGALAGCASESAVPDATLRIADLLGGSDTLHERAAVPRTFVFPDDHGAHPEFRTEWWYFTGNLTAQDGRELGFQLTFFRSALLDSATFVARSDTGTASGWRTRHAWMAHFAVTDARARRFTAQERFARGAAGLAGAQPEPFTVWLDDWSAAAESGTFPLRLRASSDDAALDLVLERGKEVVLQGDAGLSAKGPERGNASYYYSFTRMPARGTIRIDGMVHEATGYAWLDREWSTSVLTADVTGWDWISLQLTDTTELMLFRLRRSDGSTDPFNAGTFVHADGTTTRLTATDFTMTPRRQWRSPAGHEYPVAWTLDVPAVGLVLDVDAALDAQELNLSVRYWEGMVRARGERAGRAVTARGYLEMTGYAGDTGRSGR